jgi:Xaa-Pro aminopeptidase
MVIRRITAVVLICLVGAVHGSSQDLKYLEYDSDLTPPAVYKARRDSVRAVMGPDAVAFFFSPGTKMKNGDSDYPFRPDDNMYYLTGFSEPNCVLALSTRGFSIPDPDDSQKRLSAHEILFVQPRDPQREKWVGRSFGPEGAIHLRGLQLALNNDRFAPAFHPMMGGTKTLYVSAANGERSGTMADLWKPVLSFIDALRQNYSAMRVEDPAPIVNNMRRVKSSDEIRLIAKASEIGAKAHVEGIKSVEPGMYEHELEGVYHHVTRKLGGEGEAYPAIVASGENGPILHYNTNRRQMKNGDLVLVDYGSEYHLYATDITRTYPVNGKFSAAQREIYQVVLDAQEAALAMMKPGVSWQAVNQRSREVVGEGLLRLGVMKENTNEQISRFYYHGLGHSVGLNVHDAGISVLEPGVVYTVEPGVYIAEGQEGVDPKYWNIGVRIEDTIVVTEDGYKNLSASAPREIKEIEQLMKKRGLGNTPL